MTSTSFEMVYTVSAASPTSPTHYHQFVHSDSYLIFVTFQVSDSKGTMGIPTIVKDRVSLECGIEGIETNTSFCLFLLTIT